MTPTELTFVPVEGKPEVSALLLRPRDAKMLYVFGHGAGAGTFHYQIWFRNQPIGFCDPVAAFNLSNGLTLTWP